MKTASFEDKMGELEKIVETLEAGKLTLDESLRLFERGVKLSADGMKLLDESEERVRKLIVLPERGHGESTIMMDDTSEEL